MSTEEYGQETTVHARRSDLGRMVLLAAGVGGLIAARAIVRRARAYDLRGKVVLITGGSRGLGLVMAREFLREGARVAICARDRDELDRAKEDLARFGPELFTLTCDVTDRKQLEDTVLAVNMQFGALDVLVSNAGVIQVGPMESMTDQDYREAMDVHFWAPLYGAMAAIPLMLQRGGGRIVNITSVGGKIAVPHMLPYSASKFAAVGLSEGMRAELTKAGILVTTVCPGLVRTGSHVHAHFKGHHKREYAVFTLPQAVPGLSIGAERAARRIVNAVKSGDPEVVLGPAAQVATALHGLFPGLTMDVLSAVNRLLPGPGGIGTSRATGRDSETRLTRSGPAARLQRAAARNNELG